MDCMESTLHKFCWFFPMGGVYHALNGPGEAEFIQNKWGQRSFYFFLASYTSTLRPNHCWNCSYSVVFTNQSLIPPHLQSFIRTSPPALLWTQRRRFWSTATPPSLRRSKPAPTRPTAPNRKETLSREQRRSRRKRRRHPTPTPPLPRLTLIKITPAPAAAMVRRKKQALIQLRKCQSCLRHCNRKKNLLKLHHKIMRLSHAEESVDELT